MNKLNLAKKITSYVAGYGAGIIIERLIDDNTSEPDKTHQKVAVKVGSFALGAMIADAVASYTDRFIESIYSGVRQAINPESDDK